MKIATLLVSSALYSGLLACGGSVHDASAAKAAVSARRVWLPAMTLLQAEHSGTDTRCQMALTAELTVEGSELRGIVLSDYLSGECDAQVGPNKRYYALEAAGDDTCGHKVYRGWLGSAQGTSRLELKDRTSTTCASETAGTFELLEHTSAQAGAPALPRRFFGGW